MATRAKATSLDPIIPAKGLNFTRQPEVIEPTEGSDGLNVEFVGGVVRRRPGTVKISTANGLGGPIRLLSRFITRAGTEYLVACTSDGVHVYGPPADEPTSPLITQIDWLDENVVTVTGTDFGPTQGTGALIHDPDGTPEELTVLTWSDTVITATGDPEAHYGDWDVRTDAGLTQDVTYTQPIYITSAVRSMTVVVTLAGSGFGASLGASTITVDGHGTWPYTSGDIVVSSWGATGIELSVNPAYAGGTYLLTVGADTATCYET